MTRTLAVPLRFKPVCMVLAFGILGMRSGIADGVFALGNAKGGPTFGWAAGFSKGSADAATHALNECRGKYKCEVVATFHDQCFAISSNGTATQWKSNIGFGLAIEKDSATAAQEAISQCESMAGQGAAAARDPKVRLRGLSEIATNPPRMFLFGPGRREAAVGWHGLTTSKKFPCVGRNEFT
jgi:hypothetical protein